MRVTVYFLAIAAFFHASTSEPSPTIVPIEGGRSGDGITTRYWDCCAPSCAWDGIIHTKDGKPVQTCKIDGITNSSVAENAKTGCEDGGVAYMCSNQVAWVVNSTLAYGFSAASFTGGVDTAQCCICMLLSFKGQLAGKKFLVQITNTGSPLAVNQFDLAMPGGGVGIFEKGCSSQWGTRMGGEGLSEVSSSKRSVINYLLIYRLDANSGSSTWKMLIILTFLSLKSNAPLNLWP
ncbi:hypothetical protein JTB14_026056 [Gonioctena quinquepunctata]|nr:hypothetical protein JTB14_026056 [Gonioctena quinquepunctata]